MGMTIQMASLLLRERRQRPFIGSVLQIGRQSILFDPLMAERLWQRERLAFSCGAAVTDRDLFSGLGFDDVRSCDISDRDGADYVFDMNYPAPSELAGRFDCVIDGGSLEHIFNFPQALANIHHVLKPGGRAIHVTVSSNNLDHGFYMFSPTVFHDYYTQCAYRLHDLLVCEFHVSHNFQFLDDWRVYQYKPGCLDHLAHRGLGDRILMLFCVAEKTAESRARVDIVQGYYQRLDQMASTVAVTPPRRGIAHAAKEVAKRMAPGLYTSALSVWGRRFRRKPPLAFRIDRTGAIR